MLVQCLCVPPGYPISACALCVLPFLHLRWVRSFLSVSAGRLLLVTDSVFAWTLLVSGDGGAVVVEVQPVALGPFALQASLLLALA